MQTAGELLRKKRQEKNLTLDQVEKAIKVKKKFLELLEKNSFEEFSSEVYAGGFIKNYSEFLGLSSERILAIFRRQFREKEKPSLFEKTDKEPFFKITPQRIKWGLVLILLLLFFGYLFRQYQFLIGGPSLVIFEPGENAVVHQDRIVIKGKTDVDAKVFINNEEIYPSEKGEFSQEILLSEGTNQVTIFAENQTEKKTTVVRKITFDPF